MLQTVRAHWRGVGRTPSLIRVIETTGAAEEVQTAEGNLALAFRTVLESALTFPWW